MRRLIRLHISTLKSFRRTPDKNEVERASERAAALGQELMGEVPFQPHDKVASFYERYVEGNRAIDQGLAAALLDKREEFIIREVTAPNTLQQEREKDTSVAVNNDMPELLERDAFNLLMKQVNYDTDVYAVLGTRTRRRSARYSKRKTTGVLSRGCSVRLLHEEREVEEHQETKKSITLERRKSSDGDGKQTGTSPSGTTDKPP